jgi:hypothetical protein
MAFSQEVEAKFRKMLSGKAAGMKMPANGELF